MEVYYVMAGIWGLMKWHSDSKKNDHGPVVTPSQSWLWIAIVTIAVHALIYVILVKFTDSTVPFFDSMTTAMSIIAMWMLSRKYLEQWLVWLAVDVITTGLYIYKDLYITSGLYALYSVLAVVGYIKWKKLCI